MRTLLVLLLAVGALSLRSRSLAGPNLLKPDDLAVGLGSAVTLSWEVGVQTNLVENGGFESGTAGWLRAVTLGNGFKAVDSAQSPEGTKYGSFAESNLRPPVDVFVAQSLAVPSYPATVRLSWTDITLGAGAFSGQYRVRSRPVGGVEFTNLFVALAGQNGGNWSTHEADLSAFRGLSILVEFGLTNSLSEFMECRLDNVRAEVIPISPTYELFVGKTPDSAIYTTTLTGTTKKVIGLKPSTTYYWRVDQIVGTSRSAGPVRKFTTANANSAHPPKLRVSFGSDGHAHLVFATESAYIYQVIRSANLDPAGWAPQGNARRGDGNDADVDLGPGDADATMYRVLVVF